MKTKLTPEMEKYFIKNAFVESQKSMASKFGVSREIVKRVFKKHDIKTPKEVSIRFRSEKRKGITSFTKKEDLFISENYLQMPVKTIARELNRSYTGVMGRLKVLDLQIPKNIVEQRKKDSLYNKGHVPFNKGKKLDEYLTPEQIEKQLETSFKKGNIPHNAKKPWEEVKRKDSAGNTYWLIKLPWKSKLVYKHIWLWEKENGPVPKGFNVVFINGNSLDCRIENLKCISNADLMKQNSYLRFPEELRELIQMKGALKRQINKIEKNNGNSN